MITASHNQLCDNGIKVADLSGGMLTQDWEPFADQLANVPDLESLSRICKERKNPIVGKAELGCLGPIKHSFVGLHQIFANLILWFNLSKFRVQPDQHAHVLYSLMNFRYHKNGVLLLDYDYMPNGSLDNHIFCE